MRSRKALAALAVVAVGCMMLAGAPRMARADKAPFVTNPARYVDTLIGTGSSATGGQINNFPGAAVPFGMVQYSPDTTDASAGYHHDNDHVRGFSLTHASVGCPAFGDFPMLPTTTPIGAEPWSAWEKIAHDNTEVGAPGSYTVRFPDTGVSAELTATTRTGVGRFHYPRNGKPALFRLRPGGSLAGDSASAIDIGGDNTTITGSATTRGFCVKNTSYRVYFAMKFSRPFTSYGTWDGKSVFAGARRAESPSSGGYVAFPAGSVLEVRTAVSYISVDAARANLAAEGGKSFDDVRAAASAEWNAALSRIRVAGTNTSELQTFYTSLYRSLLHPNTFNDADGRYLGFDGSVHTVAKGHTQYANFSDWDTYRCLAALQALLFPERASDMAQSLVNDAEQSGSLPRWALANSATGEMTGDSVTPLIVNLYMFGAKDFDVKKALYYMRKAGIEGGVGRGDYVERPGIATYLQHGYAPQTEEFRGDHGIDGASITLEWSVDDFAISRFADALDEVVIAAEFRTRAPYWHNLFDPATGSISPRSAEGIFLPGSGFSGPTSDFGQDGFEEGNAEQYLWLVPQNIAGLVTALGGRQPAADRLDRFTMELNAGPDKPHLWIGNEPGFAVPWLYNYVGQPWKAQERVDRVRTELFGPTPAGEPGNDDLGALSSWYVWAAVGLYPITPGTGILTVNSPLFDRIEIALPAGKSIAISAPGVSNGMKYINSVGVDGKSTDQTFLPESIIHDGGDVTFSLATVPNTAWGTAESSAPPSFSAGTG